MILDKIIERKREEVAALQRRRPLSAVSAEAGAADAPRGFVSALAAGPFVAVIAEIKRKSPSAGVIRRDYDAAALARAYRSGGAAALSVLTDEHFFGGRLEHAAEARSAAPLPVLRKDFLIDPYQVFESRAAGSDAVLLIVRILEGGLLGEMLAVARELGMAALVEVHNAAEAERAAAAGAEIIGINNRDLDSLAVDLATTESVARGIPAGRVIVGESGIGSAQDVERLARAGVRAVLVGELLLRSGDIVKATQALGGVPRVI